MKKSRIILFGVIFISALAFASCGSNGSKKTKEYCSEGEKKECCEKKDNANCEHKCVHESAEVDSTKK